MALNDLLDDSSCSALPVFRLSNSSSSLFQDAATTLAADARIDERFHHDLAGSTTCLSLSLSRTVGQVLMRGLSVREPVLHGEPGVAPSQGTWRSVITDTPQEPVHVLDLWFLHGLVCSLHCEDLLSVAPLGYPLRTWSFVFVSLRERPPDSALMRRQHCLLNSWEREVLTLCHHLNVHHSLGVLRLQRFHSFLDSGGEAELNLVRGTSAVLCTT